ncbi:PREDICTED: uncharacterized protein LOC103594321 [Galeopterus variegatus]|uniref:Uncharacterized protein LOC103594321 n=1 Tax=Galeopterus variegatus TaxID=482537 RepID=A0ABM0R569_GALVR|nr:PREDICTED: uncharacterized protein LOC103594321 [Galeopterus variegatus]
MAEPEDRRSWVRDTVEPPFQPQTTYVPPSQQLIDVITNLEAPPTSQSKVLKIIPPGFTVCLGLCLKPGQEKSKALEESWPDVGLRVQTCYSSAIFQSNKHFCILSFSSRAWTCSFHFERRGLSLQVPLTGRQIMKRDVPSETQGEERERKSWYSVDTNFSTSQKVQVMVELGTERMSKAWTLTPPMCAHIMEELSRTLSLFR